MNRRVIDSLEWSPAILLPGIDVRESFGNQYAQLVSTQDHRFKAIAKNFPKLRAFSRRFSDSFGVRAAPSCIIFHRSFAHRHTDGHALLAFRDAIAASVILPARARAITTRSSFGVPKFANSFDFYPWMLDVNLDGIVIANQSVLGSHMVEYFHGQPVADVPHQTVDRLFADEFLLSALLDVWTKKFVQRKSDRSYNRLFRSLQMAFHASKIPSGYFTSHLDLGRLTSLWVSAHEILIRDTNQAGVKRVCERLRAYQAVEKRLTCRRFRLSVKNGTIAQTLTEKAYRDVYNARNDYLHGNEVGKKVLQPPGCHLTVYQVAPVLYRLLLEVELKSLEEQLLVGSLEQMIAQAGRNSEKSGLKRNYEQALLGYRYVAAE